MRCKRLVMTIVSSREHRTAIAMRVESGDINYADRFALSSANPLIGQDLGLSIAEMGVLMCAVLWAYAFPQLPIGAMVDRIGPRSQLEAAIAILRTIGHVVSWDKRLSSGW
jgi:MFS family permease